MNKINVCKKTAILFILMMTIIFSASCSEEKTSSSYTSKNTSDNSSFISAAPDEIKQLIEFDILCSDEYFVQLKITYLMNDMRMKISRSGTKFDIFTQTVRTYSHNIVKDGMNYKIDDEKKVYSVNKATEEVKISFFDLNGKFKYIGVSTGQFNDEAAFLYKFEVTDDNNKQSELVFALKNKKLLGLTSNQTGYETKITIEDISKKLPDNAFEIPSGYKEKSDGKK